jgi:hypothetical protein
MPSRLHVGPDHHQPGSAAPATELPAPNVAGGSPLHLEMRPAATAARTGGSGCRGEREEGADGGDLGFLPVSPEEGDAGVGKTPFGLHFTLHHVILAMANETYS